MIYLLAVLWILWGFFAVGLCVKGQSWLDVLIFPTLVSIALIVLHALGVSNLVSVFFVIGCHLLLVVGMLKARHRNESKVDTARGPGLKD